MFWRHVTPMKVGLVVEWFDEHAGGVAKHVRELANALDKKGVDVTIVTNKPQKIIDDPRNIKIFKIDGFKEPIFKTNISPLATKRMKKCIEDFDIVHAHHAFSRLSLLSLSIASKFNIPSILTTHTVSFFPDYEYFWQFISYVYPRYRLTISKANKIIAVSNAAKKFISYFTNKEAIVIPNGVSIEKFKPRARSYARKKAGVNGSPIILYVGRLVPKKGLDTLITSMKKIVEKYPHAKLYIAGKGNLLPFLKTMTSILGIEKNVEFLGFVEENVLFYLYNSADVFVLPSITGESFGIVLLEAMASGLPIVASNVGGIAEVLENGEYGLLVEPGNSKELAKAIITVLENKDLRSKLAKEGRKVAEEKYAWEKVADKIIEVYSSLVERSSLASEEI
ncbi:MAG: glycosyltransferase family 1 protein [Thermoplasmata archaeon]|nr:MAG: glycosyltransferase family 1 protein [Thermoplasmata archaeon]